MDPHKWAQELPQPRCSLVQRAMSSLCALFPLWGGCSIPAANGAAQHPSEPLKAPLQPHTLFTSLWKVCRDFLLAAATVLTALLLTCSLASPGSSWLLCIKTFLHRTTAVLLVLVPGRKTQKHSQRVFCRPWQLPCRAARDGGVPRGCRGATLRGVPHPPLLLPAETQSRRLSAQSSMHKSISSPVTWVTGVITIRSLLLPTTGPSTGHSPALGMGRCCVGSQYHPHLHPRAEGTPTCSPFVPTLHAGSSLLLPH